MIFRVAMEQKKDSLNKQLLEHDFEHAPDRWQNYLTSKVIAEHYAAAENAVVVLSNMVSNKSYICYGRLGAKMGLGTENEEVESIWEKKILDCIHPDDVAGKIAWELQFLTFVQHVPAEERKDYYVQHYLRMKDDQGCYHALRHRIFYLDYDTEGNVLLALCLYTVHNEQRAGAGIYCSLNDTRVKDANVCAQGLLSERECEILSLISRGWPSKQIAEALCISVNTVNNHRQNIMRKLLCQNTTEAISVARRLGLLQ